MLLALPMGMAATSETDAVRDMVQRALAELGIKQGVAARAMDLSEPHFTRQLNGYGYIALARLLKLGPEFGRVFVLLLAEYWGLWSTAAWREQALGTMATKLTMARAGLPSRTRGQVKEA